MSWRRAFCTSIPKDRDRGGSPIIKDRSDPAPSPRIRSRFGGFFSEPSTPRLHSQPVSSPTLRCRTTAATPPSSAAVPCGKEDSESPRLQCRTRRFFHSSAPTSPRSPSAFSLLKSGLRISKVESCSWCFFGFWNSGIQLSSVDLSFFFVYYLVIIVVLISAKF